MMRNSILLTDSINRLLILFTNIFGVRFMMGDDDQGDYATERVGSPWYVADVKKILMLPLLM